MNAHTDLVRLAARGVTRNRRRTLITGTMIALGVAAVIFARGFIAGLQLLITQSMIDGRFGAFEVARTGYHDSAELAALDLDLPAAGPLVDAIAATSGVEALSGRLRFVGMVSKGESSQIFHGLGVDPTAEARVCPSGPASRSTAIGADGTRFGLAAGEGLGQDDGVVLGPDLAASIEAAVGDTVTLLVQTQSGSVDAVDAKIVGLFRWDHPDDNRRSLVIPLALAQRLLHMPGRVTSIAARVHDLEDLQRIIGDLGPALARSDPPAALRSWRDLGPYLRDVMTLQDRVLGVVMVIVFALLLSGVATTMLMSVFERTREVGMLMCLGMRRRHIMMLFLLEAMILAGLAALVGSALGAGLVGLAHQVGIPFEVPAVGSLEVHPVVDLRYVGLACGAALVSSLGAAIYPAWRASRLSPIDALRAS